MSEPQNEFMAEVEFPKAEAESTPDRPDNGSPVSAARAASARLSAAEHRRAYGLTSPPPDAAEALYYEGMAAYQHRNWEQALERFRRLKALQPARPGLDALLDEVQWFLQLEAAAPEVSPDAAYGAPRERAQSVRRKGGSWRVWGVGLLGFIGVVALLLVALQVGAPGSAARSWQTLLPWNRASEQDAQELFNRGQERLTAGDYEGAQDAFRQLLAIAPDDPQARSGLARAERQQTLAQDYAAAEAAIAEEDWERAAAELDRILAVDPGYADAQARADFVSRRSRLAALYADGSRLYDLAQWTAAIEQFEKIKELDGSYRTEAVNEFLFVCYLNAGQDLVEGTGSGDPATDLAAVGQAVEYFSRALSIHPRNRMALEARRLGGLYLEALRTLAMSGTRPIRLEALVAETTRLGDASFGQEDMGATATGCCWRMPMLHCAAATCPRPSRCTGAHKTCRWTTTAARWRGRRWPAPSRRHRPRDRRTRLRPCRPRGRWLSCRKARSARAQAPAAPIASSGRWRRGASWRLRVAARTVSGCACAASRRHPAAVRLRAGCRSPRSRCAGT